MSAVAELIRQADVLPEAWSSVSVAEALEKRRGGAITKLQTPDYLETGALPIVDQGAKLICGYTNELDAAYPYDLPLIVFGDHTRTLKYIDFPFAVGADGTQCLHPTDAFDSRFFFFALENLDLRSEGYARHFKLLKEKVIAQPPLDEQRLIAEVLRSVDDAIAAAVVVQETTRSLLHSVRHNAFSNAKESIDFASAITLVSGQHVDTEQCNNVGLGVPYLTGPSDFPDGEIIVTKFTSTPSVMCQPGDILVTVKGSGVGKAVIADSSYCISRQLMAIRSDELPTAFLFEALQMVVEELNTEASGPIPGITRAHILVKPIPVMERSAQESLAATFSSLRHQLRLANEHLELLGVCKSSVMADLLSGRVRVPA